MVASRSCCIALVSGVASAFRFPRMLFSRFVEEDPALSTFYAMANFFLRVPVREYACLKLHGVDQERARTESCWLYLMAWKAAPAKKAVRARSGQSWSLSRLPCRERPHLDKSQESQSRSRPQMCTQTSVLEITENHPYVYGHVYT